jgi:hypothetical protein
MVFSLFVVRRRFFAIAPIVEGSFTPRALNAP